MTSGAAALAPHRRARQARLSQTMRMKVVLKPLYAAAAGYLWLLLLLLRGTRQTTGTGDNTVLPPLPAVEYIIWVSVCEIQMTCVNACL